MFCHMIAIWMVRNNKETKQQHPGPCSAEGVHGKLFWGKVLSSETHRKWVKCTVGERRLPGKAWMYACVGTQWGQPWELRDGVGERERLRPMGIGSIIALYIAPPFLDFGWLLCTLLLVCLFVCVLIVVPMKRILSQAMRGHNSLYRH